MRSTSYDHVLRETPAQSPSLHVRELWSNVSQIEGGHMAHAVLAADQALFSGSVQGFVTRRATDATATVQWSVPVGRSVQALAQAGRELVVGSKRGIAVLDAATGEVLRETLGIGSVHDVVCLLYTSPSPRDATLSRMPSSA